MFGPSTPKYNEVKVEDEEDDDVVDDAGLCDPEFEKDTASGIAMRRLNEESKRTLSNEKLAPMATGSSTSSPTPRMEPREILDMLTARPDRSRCAAITGLTIAFILCVGGFVAILLFAKGTAR